MLLSSPARPSVVSKKRHFVFSLDRCFAAARLSLSLPLSLSLSLSLSSTSLPGGRTLSSLFLSLSLFRFRDEKCPDILADDDPAHVAIRVRRSCEGIFYCSATPSVSQSVCLCLPGDKSTTPKSAAALSRIPAFLPSCDANPHRAIVIQWLARPSPFPSMAAIRQKWPCLATEGRKEGRKVGGVDPKTASSILSGRSVGWSAALNTERGMGSSISPNPNSCFISNDTGSRTTVHVKSATNSSNS